MCIFFVTISVSEMSSQKVHLCFACEESCSIYMVIMCVCVCMHACVYVISRGVYLCFFVCFGLCKFCSTDQKSLQLLQNLVDLIFCCCFFFVVVDQL